MPIRRAKYYQQIIDAYNTFPRFVQKTICSLKKIYIEKDFFGPAWSALDDDSNPNTGLIGFRKKDLDAHLNIQAYNSWFEQQSFGGSKDLFVSRTLPTIVVEPNNKKVLGFLSYTFLHEIGHILDYQHHFNRSDSPLNRFSYKSLRGSWTSLSWINLKTPKADNDFVGRKEICLNACDEKYLPINTVDRFYKILFEHGYISQLSALNAMEDWAETFAVYVSKKYMDVHYKIVLPNGKEYKLDDVLNSYAFIKKIRYIEEAIKVSQAL